MKYPQAAIRDDSGPDGPAKLSGKIPLAAASERLYRLVMCMCMSGASYFRQSHICLMICCLHLQMVSICNLGRKGFVINYGSQTPRKFMPAVRILVSYSTS